MYSTLSNKYKIIIIGDAFVGKTSLIYSYINSNHNKNNSKNKSKKTPKTTIGTEYTEMFFSTHNIYFQMWDCAGQERFRAVTRLYYRGSMGCILVFDLSNINTLYSIEKYWIKTVLDNTNTPPLFLLIGNKSDLIQSEINPHITDIVDQLCKKYNMTYIETSVINNINVIKAFNTFASQLYSQKQPIITDIQINLIDNEDNTYLNNIYSYC